MYFIAEYAETGWLFARRKWLVWELEISDCWISQRITKGKNDFFLPFSDEAYRIPRPLKFSVQFKQLVQGLQVKLAAEEDRASGLASVSLLDLLTGLPRLESFRLFRDVPTNTVLDSTESGGWVMISEAPLFISPPSLLMAAVGFLFLVYLRLLLSLHDSCSSRDGTWQPE